MPALANVKVEVYCQFRSRGKTQIESARMAGYAHNSAGARASVLEKRPDVAARIQEIRASESKMMAEMERSDLKLRAITKQTIMSRLWVLANDRKETSSSRVRALELCGRELGMFTETHKHTHEWNGDPATLTDQQLERFGRYMDALAYGEDEARRRAQARLESGMVLDVEVVKEQLEAPAAEPKAEDPLTADW